MEMHKEFRMIGGEDEASYANNSSHQRLVLLEVKPILQKCIEQLLGDINMVPQANCIKVADMGCSSGPNTFFTVKEIIDNIDKTSRKMNHQEPPPMIQVFLNDLVSNDFNIVFKSLPPFYEKLEKENGRKQQEGSCLVAAMPGSFYGKLFPHHSMHFCHSSYSLHWLSQVPPGLVTQSGIPLNKGNIYPGKTSPPIVQQAYRDQFTHDFTRFLRMRSLEMVQHGQLLLTFLCKDPEEVEGSNYLDLMGMALSDMVVEGYLKEEKLDTFNIPMYTPSVVDTKQIIEREGSFKILKIKTFKTLMDASFLDSSVAAADHDKNLFARAFYVATFIRAVHEPNLSAHFGEAIHMDDLFRRLAKKLVKNVQNGEGCFNNIVISLRKE